MDLLLLEYYTRLSWTLGKWNLWLVKKRTTTLLHYTFCKQKTSCFKVWTLKYLKSHRIGERVFNLQFNLPSSSGNCRYINLRLQTHYNYNIIRTILFSLVLSLSCCDAQYLFLFVNESFTVFMTLLRVNGVRQLKINPQWWFTKLFLLKLEYNLTKIK